MLETDRHWVHLVGDASELQPLEDEALLEQLRSLLHALDNASLKGVQPGVDFALLQLVEGIDVLVARWRNALSYAVNLCHAHRTKANALGVLVTGHLQFVVSDFLIYFSPFLGEKWVSGYERKINRLAITHILAGLLVSIFGKIKRRRLRKQLAIHSMDLLVTTGEIK